MIGDCKDWQDELFVAGSLKDLIPDDHILKRVDRAIDFSWVRDDVRAAYDEEQGRPSIDPESALRLMLAGFFQGIVHDRKLMRESQVNLAIRWFAGYKLHEKLPNHSSLTRIRQRWGEERFKKIFERVVQECVNAGLVDAETVHIDATLIRADVSWESVTEKHVEKVLEENAQEESGNEDKSTDDTSKKKQREQKKYSTTDPDATMATSSHKYHLEPSYKQHTVIDDRSGVIVDVVVTTGEENEGKLLLEQIERVKEITGQDVKRATADRGYAHSGNYGGLERQGIDPVIPPVSEQKKPKHIPVRRFKYDEQKKIVRCPHGAVLKRRSRGKNGWWYRSDAKVCEACPMRKRCFSEKANRRSVMIVDDYCALLRARRRKARGWDDVTQAAYWRHRGLIEGRNGEAKTQHGLRRAVRRGLANVAIQVYLTAIVMNLKRLAGAIIDRRRGCCEAVKGIQERIWGVIFRKIVFLRTIFCCVEVF